MKKLFVSAICLFISGFAYANEMEENWHQWRGPYANGYAPNADPPTQWSETENIKWKAELPGEGSATPIIWGDKMFVVAAKEIENESATSSESEEQSDRGRRRRFRSPAPTHEYQFIVMCVNKNNGDIIWQDIAVQEVPHEGHHSTGSYAAGSPTTDGENLYVTFGSRGLFCYDLDGNQKWSKDLGDMQTRNSFGEGTSVAVHGDALIFNWDHEGDSYLYCLDKTTGDIRWKTPRDERTSWNTPLITEYDGITQIITNGSNRARGYDLKNGELLWECGGQTDNPIPSPLRYEDMVICTSGFRGSAMYAIPLDARGDITNSDKLAWSHNQDTPYVPSPLLYNGHLYFMKSNNAILTSVKAADGIPVISTTRLDLRGNIYASPVGASDRVYICSREGETLVLQHGSELKVLAVNQLDDVFDASPIALGNQLFLRGKDTLYCIEE